MAKVTDPLLSVDASGRVGKMMIHRRGGIVTRYFSPKNPNTIAQQAHRIAFKEYYMASLTQAQADLLYAAILHSHDDLYSLLGHVHDHGGMSGLGDDDHTQYLTQTRGDARYPLKTALHREFIPWGTFRQASPLTANGYPFLVTLDRTVTFIKCTVCAYVETTNNASNYWNIAVRIATAANVKVFSTAAMSINAWANLSATTFDIASAGAADLHLQVYCSKTGSPGALYVAAPMLEVGL